jgi:hypothetical protein
MGLKYCKRCGENLSHTFQPPQYREEPRGTSGTIGIALAAWGLALSTVAITLGGFGIIFSYAFDLMRPVPMGQSASGDAGLVAMIMLVLGSLVIFGIVAMLIRVFSKLMGVNSPRAEKRQAAQPVQRPMGSDYPPAQLSAPPPSMSSVTEHTTRNFDLPQYREPKARE